MLADSGLLTINATLIVQLVTFLLVAFVLWRLAWGPITRVIEQRGDRIEAGLRAAEDAEKRLATVQADVSRELEEARNQAREILSRAHQEASADADETRQRARREAEAQLERARSDIQAERDRAIQDVRTEVSALVVEAAGRVLGRAMDDATHRRLIEESLQEVTARE